MKVSDEITSLDSLQKKIERYEIVYPGRLFFRGENKEYRGRTPGILRDEGFAEHEADFYSDLLKMHQQELLNETDYIDRLALMQHYGAPTRLIDMSSNPYVALYFACEESKDEDPGYLYMYVPVPVSKNHEAVRILSWMACNRWINIDEVCKNYQIQYARPLNPEHAKEIIADPVFISQEGFAGSSNERIHAQRGTFVICGEQEINEKWHIIGLDAIEPTLIFRITPEYKGIIREELNGYGINTGSVYKDFMSASRFLRSKYSEKDEDIDESDYEIIESDKGSLPYRKAKELQMIMKRRRPIDSIHNALKNEILRRGRDCDVIWAYVSMSQKDYVSQNYRTMMQWINPNWKFKDKFPPKPFKQIGDDGFSWQDNLSTSIMSDFDNEYLYSQPEEYIFVSAYALFEKAKIIYDVYRRAWDKSKDKDSLEKAISDKAGECEFINREWDSIGIPVDKDVANLLNRFSSLFVGLDTLTASLNNQNYKFLVPMQLKNMQKDIEEIESKKTWWRSRIEKTDDELNAVEPFSLHKERPCFKPTIPAVGVPLEVRIEFNADVSENGTVKVTVKTNLYDFAELMVTLKDADTGKILGTSKSVVHNGIAVFESIGKPNSIQRGSRIKVSLSLPVSSTQNIEFVKKTGIQYENITGDFIDDEGFMPSGRVEKLINL